MASQLISRIKDLPLRYCILITFSGINLVYMHYYVISTSILEFPLDDTSIIDNLTGVLFDTFIIFLFSCIPTFGKVKSATAITFILTILLAFSNIIYSRFFDSYLTISAISHGTSIFTPIVFRSIIQGFELKDFYFIIIPFIFYIIYRKAVASTFKKTVFIIVIFLLASILCDLIAHAYFCIIRPNYRYFSYYTLRLNNRHIAKHHAACEPLITTYHRGIIRMLSAELSDEISGNMKLSTNQKIIIKSTINDSKNSIIPFDSLTTQNIIFIIVESYMSFTSEMTINGKEITPFLNSLRHDSTVYYNGHVTPNITLGESSDGQFIYMTGLLPMRSSITISKIRNKILPGLPKVLSNKKYSSRMIIPTQPSLWNQSTMCQKYGFQQLFSSEDYDDNHRIELNDKEVFELASRIDKNNKHLNFLSVILTVSMHQPYVEPIDKTFSLEGSSLSYELKNYLNACHYTDDCIRKYFHDLKKNNLYKNSLIIITADHHVHNTDFGSNITKELPLYIINGKINNNLAWHGTCNQIDVYTTLLNLLDIKSNWYGLGHSLLSSKYKNSLDNNKWNTSDMIILSDFFKK